MPYLCMSEFSVSTIFINMHFKLHTSNFNHYWPESETISTIPDRLPKNQKDVFPPAWMNFWRLSDAWPSNWPELGTSSAKHNERLPYIEQGDTVDGWNPKQPPFGCIKPYKSWDKTTNLNWLAGFLKHQQYYELLDRSIPKYWNHTWMSTWTWCRGVVVGFLGKHWSWHLWHSLNASVYVVYIYTYIIIFLCI